VDDSEWQLLSTIARRFYLEDASKTELATEFGLSRFRIARLLRQAQDEGVVSIEIRERDTYRTDLATELAEHLQLRECVVLRAANGEEDNRRRLARAAATFIKERANVGDLLGFSWGRTLASVGEELVDLPPCTIIQLTGTVGSDFAQSPIDVIRRIVLGSSVEATAVFAPLFAGSPTSAQSFRQDPTIAQALARYSDLDLAVLSVGSWDPPITQLTALVTPTERAELAREHAKAEMAGIFIRADGTLIEAEVVRRRISVTPEQLLACPRVLAVAGSPEKAGAIAAIARTGLITSLVTDDRAAAELLSMPAIKEPVLQR
jgi:DNA-binding transcriptional regulator LsrR (DeoR family)